MDRRIFDFENLEASVVIVCTLCAARSNEGFVALMFCIVVQRDKEQMSYIERRSTANDCGYRTS